MDELTDFDLAVENLDPNKAQQFIIQTLQKHTKALDRIEGELEASQLITIINGGGRERPKKIPRDQFFQDLFDRTNPKVRFGKLSRAFQTLKPILEGIFFIGMIIWYLITWSYMSKDPTRQEELKQSIIQQLQQQSTNH